MVQEKRVIQREARVVERERLALVRCGRDDDLGDALVLELRACSHGIFLRHLYTHRTCERAHLLFGH